MAKTQKAKTASAQPQQGVQDQSGFDVLRTRLLEQRREMYDLYNQDVRAGQESADDGTEDIVDRANNHYNRELMFSLSDTERQRLLQIEDALRRLDEGTYGRCGNCGGQINPLRLDAVPWTRYCIDCQELVER
ncbi:MAG TPA: TraR/DksA family transcriptional regulator, partial [Thermoanaerobaculia bacterium]|nr:TraR/DksA family transcriptional regulator [Thermoanaerobaculia bacterium]